MQRLAITAASILACLCSAGCGRQTLLLVPGDNSRGLDAGVQTGTDSDSGRSGAGRDGGGADDARFCKVSVVLRISMSAPTNVVFMVGRNPTMKNGFGAKLETTRIQAVTRAIRDATTSFPDAINFGYMSFPGMDPQGTCGAGCCVDSPVTCSPVSDKAIGLALAPCDSGVDTKGCISPVDNRPLVDAFGRLTNVFPDNGRRDIILFADSAPGCGDGLSPPTACDAVQAKIETLMASSGRKTNIHVIPIGDNAVDCLPMIAVKGGTNLIPPVASMEVLSRNLNQILHDDASPFCSINLIDQPEDRSDVQLYLDGNPIDKDSGPGGDGWNFTGRSSGTIEVHGAACTQMQGLHFESVMVRQGSLCTP